MYIGIHSSHFPAAHHSREALVFSSLSDVFLPGSLFYSASAHLHDKRATDCHRAARCMHVRAFVCKLGEKKTLTRAVWKNRVWVSVCFRPRGWKIKGWKSWCGGGGSGTCPFSCNARRKIRPISGFAAPPVLIPNAGDRSLFAFAPLAGADGTSREVANFTEK